MLTLGGDLKCTLYIMVLVIYLVQKQVVIKMTIIYQGSICQYIVHISIASKMVGTMTTCTAHNIYCFKSNLF